MKASLVLLGNVFLATSILATPGRFARHRTAHAAKSHPAIPVGGQPEQIQSGDAGAAVVKFSGNWAGAVLDAPPAGQIFTSASGQFTVPTPSFPSGVSEGSFSASAWVGIDGDTYNTAILQAGVDFTISDKGVQYDAWYEWYPDSEYKFTGFNVKAGDVIRVTIEAPNYSSGNITMENLSDGGKVSKSLIATDFNMYLGNQNAEWIVEDFQQGFDPVPLVDWGTVAFTNCTAGTGAQNVHLGNATIYQMKQNGTLHSKVTVGGNDSSVTVAYV